MAAPAPPKYTPRAPTRGEILNYGRTVATARAATDPRVWAQFTQKAHKGGFTVAGMLSGAPAPLRERTLSSLKQEAQTSVNTAYKPVTQQLDAQESRIKALDAKRAADNKSYMTWLDAANTAINTSARGADTLLANRAQQIHDDAQASWAAVQPEALAAMQAHSTASDPNQSSTLGEIAQAKAKGDAQAESGLTENTAIRAAGADTSAMMDRAVLSGATAADNQRKQAFDASLAKVFDARGTAAINKAKDYLTTFGNLKTTEINKASKIQDYNALAAKLGVAQDTLTLKGQALAASTANAKANQAIAQENAAIAAGHLRLAQGKADLNGDGVVNAADTVLAAKIKAKYGKKPKGPAGYSAAQQKTSTHEYQTVETIRSKIFAATKNPKLSVDAKGNTIPLAQWLSGLGYDAPSIALAQALHNSKGQMSAGLRQQALNLGILNPYQLWGQPASTGRAPGGT